MEEIIDVNFDFTTDTPHYWDKPGMDPDGLSPTLRKYHKILWSKELPNGEFMDLQMGSNRYYYLTWKDFCFASDSIIVELWHARNKKIIDQVRERLEDSEGYYLNLLHKSYTIGGMIIFPQHRNSMNQMKGMNARICDRWDLTMECIRRYYQEEDSPLYKWIRNDKEFFDLFFDFKGYTDFFFLQDCVSEEYSSVDIWCGDASFSNSGLPETVEDYFEFIRKEHEFLDKRNKRIHKYCVEHNLVNG